MTEPTITSLQNQRVKDAARLRDRRQRDKQRRMIIDGARELLAALRAGIELTELFVCVPLCDTAEAREVVRLAKSTPAAVLPVSVQVFARLAYGERVEGVVGVAATPAASLARLTLPDRPLVAVLEGAEKPGNVGAVLRSADGAGVSAVVVAGGRTDLYNPNTIRASLGTIFSVPVAAAETRETLAWLRQRGLAIYATRPEAARDYTAVDLSRPAAVVLGSEAEGLSSAWNAADVTPIRVPMRGVADSLNVSATAAVIFYEAWRQRASQR